jgi:hypothetical protein
LELKALRLCSTSASPRSGYAQLQRHFSSSWGEMCVPCETTLGFVVAIDETSHRSLSMLEILSKSTRRLLSELLYLSNDLVSAPLTPHLVPGTAFLFVLGGGVGGVVFFGRPPSSFVAYNEAFQQAPARPCSSGWDHGYPFPSPQPLNFLVLEVAPYAYCLNAPYVTWKSRVALVLVRSKKQWLHWRVKFFQWRRRSSSFGFGIWESCMIGEARKQRRYSRRWAYQRRGAPLRAAYPHLPCFLGVLVSVYKAITQSF